MTKYDYSNIFLRGERIRRKADIRNLLLLTLRSFLELILYYKSQVSSNVCSLFGTRYYSTTTTQQSAFLSAIQIEFPFRNREKRNPLR